jgi:hypothetical protein
MDNIKVLYDAWIPLAVPFAAQYFLFFIRKPHRTACSAVTAVLLLASVVSGMLSCISIIATPIDILSEADTNFGKWVAEGTPIDAVWLAHGSTSQPVSTVGGRQIFLGFLGWVASHGLPAGERLTQESHLWTHWDDIEAFRNAGIEYVVEEEKRFTTENASYFWELVFDDDRRKVWRSLA